jgi:hypothetical protein
VADEAARVAALRAYGVLDGPAPPGLEAVLRVVAELAGVPTAAINLIDSDMQRPLVTVGFVGADGPRSQAMCEVAVAEQRPSTSRTRATIPASPPARG